MIYDLFFIVAKGEDWFGKYFGARARGTGEQVMDTYGKTGSWKKVLKLSI